METFIDQLKLQLLDQLNLTDVDPDTVGADDPLFGDEGLGLDSIDSLEIVVLLDKNYGIKISSPDKLDGHMNTLRTLAEFIQMNQLVAA